MRVQAYSGMLDQAVDQATEVLRRRRNVAYNAKDNFSIRTAAQEVEEFHNIMLMVYVATLVLSAIGLLIGGVGVMNIMLVSVDERIREIGLRRALGARKRHIKLQFLAETLLIMLLGGAIGIVISYAIAAAVGTLPMMGPLFEDESGRGDIHLKISLLTVLLSTGVLLLVGVASGMVPALRASKLDPVEALRYE
jgi:putative ABC transport system permease protein